MYEYAKQKDMSILYEETNQRKCLLYGEFGISIHEFVFSYRTLSTNKRQFISIFDRKC